jgi:hypothetical protein
MWADDLSPAEAEFTRKAIARLRGESWAEPVVHRLSHAGGICSKNMPLMFELRYAYELSRKSVSAEYEFNAGVNESTVEFRFSSTVTWLVELVSIRTSQAAKRAVTKRGLIYQQILATDSEDKAQSEEAEMITAQQKIGEKVFANGRPTKFPLPLKNAYGVILVDARGYLDQGGDVYDYLQMAYGPAGVPQKESWRIHFWRDENGVLKPIRGLFERGCPLRAAKYIQERIHFLGFVVESAFVDGELPANAYYFGNPHLLTREESESVFEQYPLFPRATS